MSSTNRSLLVRTVWRPAAVLGALRRESQRAAPGLPYVDAHAFDDIFQTLLSSRGRSGSTVFLAAFGVLSLIVAAFGLAAVAVYAVARRTGEIGIRAALGARPGDLYDSYRLEALSVVVVGLAVGMGLAWAAGRILSAQLFDIAANNPYVLAAAAVGLLLVGSVSDGSRRGARLASIPSWRCGPSRAISPRRSSCAPAASRRPDRP